MPEIVITLSTTGHGAVAIATNMQQPRVGRPLSYGETLALDMLNQAKRQTSCTGVEYGAALGESAGDQALNLANELLRPEGFGFSCTPEVRNAARRVLGIKSREALAA